jgi:hypothetical protein
MNLRFLIAFVREKFIRSLTVLVHLLGDRLLKSAYKQA